MEKIIHYWNNQPCNINHSSLEKCTKEYFDEVEKRKYFVENHIPAFVVLEQTQSILLKMELYIQELNFQVSHLR